MTIMICEPGEHPLVFNLIVMKDNRDSQLQNKFRRWSKWLALIPAVAGLVSSISWYLGRESAVLLGVQLQTMNPIAALGFIAISTAYYFLFYLQNHFASIVGYIISVTMVVASATLAFHGLFQFNLLPGVGDSLIQSTNNHLSELGAPSLPFVVAFGFLIATSGLLLNKVQSRYGYLWIHLWILLLFVWGLITFLAFLYKAEHLYAYNLSMPLSFSPGLCFISFSLALLFLQPDKGLTKHITGNLTGNLLLRALLPTVIITPPIFGLISLVGYKQALYTEEQGSLYFVLGIITVGICMVVVNAYMLNKRELAKQAMEKALSDSDRQLRILFDNAPEAVVVANEGGYITRWNPEAVRLFGWTPGEAIGRRLTDLITPDAVKQGRDALLKRYALTRESSLLGKATDLKMQNKFGVVADISVQVSSFTEKDELQFVGFFRDVSERKKMEKQLQLFNESLSRQVEEKTREHLQMLERLTDSFFALDSDLKFTYINSKASDLLRRKPEEVIGKYVWEIFPEREGAESSKAIRNAMKTQQHVRVVELVEPFGLWFEIDTYPSPNGVTVFVKDITQQRKKEEEVAEARSLADNLINSLPGVFYFYDADGRFIRWNRKLEEVTGYSSEEIAQLQPVSLFPEDEREYISQRIQLVFETGSNVAEAHFLSKDGRKTPYYFRATLIQYNGRPCLLGTGIDITERKKAEQELQESEQKYKLMFEGNPLAMWMMSLPDYKIIDVNQACLKQYGYTRMEFLNLDMADLLPEDLHDRLMENINREFRGLYNSGVWKQVTKHGDILYAEIVTHDVYYHGKPVRLILAKEVTEQYLSEEKLRQSYDEIKKLTEYLQKVREEERTRISREIHDELGQLLTALKMDISWINRSVPSTDIKIKEKVQGALEYIDFTISSVRRIASELRPAILDDLGLQAAIKWHIENFEALYGIPVEARLEIGDMMLSEEHTVGLFRILQESLTNVARHAGASKVMIALKQQDHSLHLTISDNGRGFDPKANRHKTLGLLGMKERVTVMGGVYSIDSTIGKGTTVTIVVPL